MSDTKPKVRFSSKIVVASVSAVLFYTLFIFFLELLNVKYGTNIQIPSELTAAWYTFWTVELVCLASIRKSKIKNKYEYDDPDREKGMSEIINELRQIKEGTAVATPSVSTVPEEVVVNNSPVVITPIEQESTAPVNEDLNNSLPTIDDEEGYNNAFPNDKYITGG